MSVSMLPVTEEDAMVEAFCNPRGPDIFRPVAYPSEVWTPDPLDVEAIHADARDLFEVLLSRATRHDEADKVGRILLLLGESGSGKTHLMRAFRTRAHQQAMGYFGYMQMTTSSGNYSRYILHKLIDSLDTPYYSTPANPDVTTGLFRLSTAVAESPMLEMEQVRRLREDNLGNDERSQLVLDLAEEGIRDSALQDVPIDLIMAMLFFQSDNPAIRSRVIKYLRAEDLSDHDRRRLGGISPLDREEHAQTMIERLGKLMWSMHGASLIVCVDQLEDIWKFQGSADMFRRAVTGLIQIVHQVPTSLIVISCLEDYYSTLRGSLDEPALDRIEKDPGPLTLQGSRSWDEIVELVGRHLSHLFDHCDLQTDDDTPTRPLPEELLRKQVKQKTRTVLTACREFRDRCIRTGRLVEPNADNGMIQTPTVDPNLEEALLHLDQAWNDFLANFEQAPPDEDEGLVQLLAESIQHCSDELNTDDRFITDAERLSVRVRNSASKEGDAPLMLAGICNKAPHGGLLGRQIETILKEAGAQVPAATPVVVRSTEYTPKTPSSAIAKTFATLVSSNGRYVVVSDSCWRAMAAMRPFRSKHQAKTQFSKWLQHAQPLARLKALRAVLGLDEFESCSPAALGSASYESPDERTESEARNAEAPGQKWAAHELSEPVLSPAVSPEATSHEIFLGHRRNGKGQRALLLTDNLTRHMAFLGGTGSGKTTAALNIVEQLLLQGIPAILVDRKGDLVTYARQEIWNQTPEDPVLAERQSRLRQQLDVAVYTPGHPDGRPIRLPVAPGRLADMKSTERQQMVRQAAYSLGQMLGYKTTGKNASRISVMIKSIELMAQLGCEHITLKDLIDYISQRDDALISAIGVLDVKLFDGLLEALQTLLINRQLLFPTEGEPLRVEELFGFGAGTRPGKTRLSVISTKFLGDTSSIQFWVAQLLFELSRWMSKSPASKLKAVVLFDEADLYLPATSKPATKEPMEGLLKRARSAGLGVMLATQSPGDFDYKSRENINTWFLGKIKEDTAIKKMKPMLGELQQDIGAELSNQATGEFFLVQSGRITPIRSKKSLVTTEQLSEERILGLARNPRQP